MHVNVFIKSDQMKGPKCFHLSLYTTVAQLKEKVKDREGVDLEMLVYRAKPLRDNQTLSDIDFHNNGTIHAAVRYIGGAAPAEGNAATQFIKYEVEKLGKAHGASVVTENCIIGISDGCYESNVNKCKFSCGCIFCPDCLRQTLKMQCEHSGRTHFNCGNSGHSDKSPARRIDRALAYAVCIYNDAKINEMDLMLDKNSFLKETSVLSVCPKCKAYVARKWNDDSFTEECPRCRTSMCWLCKGDKHNHPDNCSRVTNIKALIDGGKMKEYNGKTVWNMRLCIDKSCRSRNTWSDACNHITCECGTGYCHFCLRNWKWHNYSNCVVRPKETVTAKYLFG